MCQCLRSSTPRPPAIRAPSAGQATTCGVPGTISWSHPGQRYAFVDPAPGIRRTTQSPSGHDSTAGARHRIRGAGAVAADPAPARAPVKAIGPDAVGFPDVQLHHRRCSVDFVGRLTAHLPEALRLLIVKADGSVLVHSDGGSYKPLNWMSPPCRLAEDQAVVRHQQGRRDAARSPSPRCSATPRSTSASMPGLVKDGVEAHLQELLAVQLDLLGEGWRLVRREYPTPIGPVDLMCRDEVQAERGRRDRRPGRGEMDGPRLPKVPLQREGPMWRWRSTRRRNRRC